MHKSPRILLVDDDPQVLDVSEAILSKLGYQVIAHSSPQEALDFFKDVPDHFDLIITDFRMPELNGAELSQEILDVNPQIPIILCSGYSSEFGHDDALSLGIKWFVRKPFLKKEFSDLVKKALNTVN